MVTKLVDLVAETLAHEMGVDLYQRGANIAMANMLYSCMPVFCGEEQTERFLQSFVNLIRHRTDTHVQAYYEAGRVMVDSSSNEEFKRNLFPFTEPRLFKSWFDVVGEMTLEPAIPALFCPMAGST